MALKLRGNTQIKLKSIELEHLKDLSPGRILGRPEAASSNYDADSASPSELHGEDIRRIADLHTDDNVTFANITGSVGNFSSTLTVQGSGTVASNLTVEGNLTVSGTTTNIETTNLLVEDPLIQIGKSNDADSKDLGFFGLYNDGSDKYAGLVRDASDSGKFKLFTTTEDITSTTTVDFTDFLDGTSYASKAVMVADIEGNITYENDVTFTLSGDVSGSATFSGSNDPTISVTIGDSSVQLSNIDFLVDEDNMDSDSAVKVPTQQSVKAYVDSKVSDGGFSNLAAKQMQMVYNNGSDNVFVNVQQNVVYHSVTSGEASSGEITLSVASEDQFDELSDVFLNGQKVRFGTSTEVDTDTTREYYFESSASKIHFQSSLLVEGDKLEIIYFSVVQ